MIALSEQVLSLLKQAPKILIAYSGGLDSTVLLHYLTHHSEFTGIKKQALHVHHGLSPRADEWVCHCEKQCQAWQVPCTVQRVQVDRFQKKGLEAAARVARYAAFETQLQKNECLVTAHHRDDQAETLLLQLLRGAGLPGLSAMPEVKLFSQGLQLRPFLSIPRSALECYAREHSLHWIDDESNEDTSFDRNYLRKTIFPLLRQRWPSVDQGFARSAVHCAQADATLQQQVENILPSLTADFVLSKWKEKFSFLQGGALSISALQKETPVFQTYLLREWFRQEHFSLPTEQQLTILFDEVIGAGKGASPLLSWADHSVYRHDDILYALKKLPKPPETHKHYDVDSSISIFPWNVLAGFPWLSSLREAGKLTLRFRQQGLRFHPASRSHSQTLKKLFQEWGVPPFLRDYWPLLYVNDQFVAVAFYGIDKSYVP